MSEELEKSEDEYFQMQVDSLRDREITGNFDEHGEYISFNGYLSVDELSQIELYLFDRYSQTDDMLRGWLKNKYNNRKQL